VSEVVNFVYWLLQPTVKYYVIMYLLFFTYWYAAVWLFAVCRWITSYLNIICHQLFDSVGSLRCWTVYCLSWRLQITGYEVSYIIVAKLLHLTYFLSVLSWVVCYNWRYFVILFTMLAFVCLRSTSCFGIGMCLTVHSPFAKSMKRKLVLVMSTLVLAICFGNLAFNVLYHTVYAFSGSFLFDND